MHIFHVFSWAWINFFSPYPDLQNVNITLRILFRPVPKELPRIYTILGEDYTERVLPSITTEVLKAVVVSLHEYYIFSWYGNILSTNNNTYYLNFQAQFDAGELITQRELVSQKVTDDLMERASQFGVILDDISIVSSKVVHFFILIWMFELNLMSIILSRHILPLARSLLRLLS